MSRRRRILLLGLAAFGLLLVALVLGLFPQEPLRRWAEGRLRSTLGPEVRIGRLHVVPARLRAEAADLVLLGPGYRLEVERLRIALAPGTLLGAGLSLREVEVERPRLVLRGNGAPEPAPTTPAPAGAGPGVSATAQPGTAEPGVSSPSGSVSPPDALAPPEAAAPPPLRIAALRVTEGRVEYEDARTGRIALEGVEARGSVGEGTLEVEAAGGVWERDVPLALGPARARLRISPQLETEVEDFEAVTAGSRLRLAGTLGRPDRLRPDLRLEGHLDLAEAARLLRRPAEGRLEIQGRWSGLPGRAEIDVRGRSLRVLGFPIDRLEAHAGLTGGEADARIALEALGGRASGEGTLSGSSMRGSLRVDGLDLGRAHREGLAGGPPLAGRASARLDFAGDPGGAVRVASSLQAAGLLADGAALRVEAGSRGDVWPAEGRIDLAWTGELEGRAETADTPGLEALHLRAQGTARGAMPADLDGRLEGTAVVRSLSGPEEIAVEGALRARGARARLDLEARGFGGAVLRTTAEARDGALERLAFAGESLPLAPFVPEARGLARFEASFDGDLRRPSGTGSVRLESLAVRGVEIGSATLEAKAERGPIDLVLEVPAFGARGEARLRLGARPDLRGRLSLAATPLSPLRALLPAATDLDGTLDAAVDVAVDLGRPEEAEVEARVERIEVTSGRLAAATASPFALKLRQRRLEVDGLDVRGLGVEARVSGRLGLDRAAPL
ncbi:MAG TPA: hypothetical protein VLI67_08665, partial [Vicinamibacteria bacterium]|nr:hypothetical protein [Vicinamibacteria bacterium]